MTEQERQSKQARLRQLHEEALDWGESVRAPWSRKQLAEVMSCWELAEDLLEEESAEHARLHRELAGSECCNAPMVKGGAQCEACGSDGKVEPAA